MLGRLAAYASLGLLVSAYTGRLLSVQVENCALVAHSSPFDDAHDLAIILAMTGVSQFEIIFDDAVEAHFAAIDRKDHASILGAIEQQLSHEATTRTRNRKPLRIPNSLNATWELRCSASNRYCVFYDVDVDDRFVVVLAVGRKLGNRLMIGNEEFEL